MKYIVQMSGGAASYVAGRLIVEEVGSENVIHLFADVKDEDPDLYRFLNDIERRMNMPIVRIAEGRTPWQVFEDEGMIGNSRADPCSRILKRELLAKWMAAHYTPETAVIVIGYDRNEDHRFKPLQERYAPWRVRAPLIEQDLFKEFVLDRVRADGLEPPRLYRMGFQHNNCGGSCIKQGQAGWALLLDMLPERYAEVEAKEEAFRQRTGKDVSILRDRTDGMTKPLTLRALRERREKSPQMIDWLDWGACQCMESVEVIDDAAKAVGHENSDGETDGPSDPV